MIIQIDLFERTVRQNEFSHLSETIDDEISRYAVCQRIDSERCMTFRFDWVDSNSDCLGLYGQVIKRIWWMPWRQQAMKDVVGCDKLRGGGNKPLIRRFPNGETRPLRWSSLSEYIGQGSERGELKHLSTRRKRNQPRFR